MSRFVYLDNAATTSTKKEVVDAMYPFFTESFGNPSSVYDFAAKNKKAVNDSRQTIADALHADVRDIYFTAGGSESDNWALIATAEAYENKGKHIITSKIEHHAILHTCEYLERRGFEVTYLDVDENGIVDLAGGIGYLTSYWLVIALFAYLLFYALVGCKNVNKDIPVE